MYRNHTDVEQEVLTNLQSPQIGFTLHKVKERFSPYDLTGKTGFDEPVFIEVKYRTKYRAFQWIEKHKIDKLIELTNRFSTYGCHALLVVVTDESSLAYDVKDIVKLGKIRNEMMNDNTTSNIGSGKKVKKSVYEFRHDNWKFDVKSGEINWRIYETINDGIQESE